MEKSAEISPDKIREQEYTKRFLTAVNKIQYKQISEQQYQEAEKKLADVLQDNWREAYIKNPKKRDKNGNLIPNWKPVIDDEWLAKAQDKNHPYHQFLRINPETKQPEVDIAAEIKNRDLPKNRREENEAAAKFAINEIKDAKTPPGDIMDEGFLIGASHEVHEAWKKRNTWAHNNKELMKAYRDIPLDEKLKDMEHIVLPAEVLTEIR